MTITFFKLVNEEEVEVSCWEKADRCEISCDRETRAEDLLEAGVWLGKHARSIADYTLNEPYADEPFIEAYRKASKAVLKERGLI